MLDGRSCRRQAIRLKTREGEVTFVGRPGGSEACGPREERVTPAGRRARRCNNKVMERAQLFCERVARTDRGRKRRTDPVLRRLCLPAALRTLAHAARCKRG